MYCPGISSGFEPFDELAASCFAAPRAQRRAGRRIGATARPGHSHERQRYGARYDAPHAVRDRRRLRRQARSRGHNALQSTVVRRLDWRGARHVSSAVAS